MLIQCWASVADDGPTLNQHNFIPFTISDLLEMYCIIECMTGHIIKKKHLL